MVLLNLVIFFIGFMPKGFIPSAQEKSDRIGEF
jgi:hypothetical protein